MYRLGWYGGDGGRLMTCLPSCTTYTQGASRPTPPPDPSTGKVDAGWPVSATLHVGSDWISGYYVGQLETQNASPAYQALPNLVPFIVTAPPAQHSAILLEVPVNTWQAYNPWGGKSLYAFNSTNKQAAVKVSFNRPYLDDGQSLFAWEIQLMRFLERQGYDVSYTTDVQVADDPAQLLNHHLVISNGHDEYWTAAQRYAFDHALALHVNLAFFGSDIGWWQTRYENQFRTLVEYRSAALDPENAVHPELDTIPFESLTIPRPPCQLMGVQYTGGAGQPQGPSAAYAPVAGSLGEPWFSQTGMTASTELAGAVGYEWDSIVAGCKVPTLTQYFFTAESPHPPADSVSYTAPSGARVFATGDTRFNWLLDQYGQPGLVNRSLQRFTTNLLDDLIGLPLDAVTPDTTPPPPPTIISGPSGGASSSNAEFKLGIQPGNEVFCALDGAPNTRCTKDPMFTGLSPGQHTFDAEQTNTAGNTSAPVTYTWQVP